jgi:hypothetical protein
MDAKRIKIKSNWWIDINEDQMEITTGGCYDCGSDSVDMEDVFIAIESASPNRAASPTPPAPDMVKMSVVEEVLLDVMNSSEYFSFNTRKVIIAAIRERQKAGI